jgi:putative NADH-flavin reductase
VRVVVRDPQKLATKHPNLEIHMGSITELPELEQLLSNVDFVVAMVGDAQVQKTKNINEEFVRQLIPAMRKASVRRLLYQAGAFSTPPYVMLNPVIWLLKNTVAASFRGQHRDNAAVMKYLWNEAKDIEWMAHRAAINTDGATKGNLVRSKSQLSVATFRDCAEYNYRLIQDSTAIHSCDLSHYSK